MKICLVGVKSKLSDEGMKNITTYMAKELSKYHEVMVIEPRKINFTLIKNLRIFNPDVIHYFHGPTIRSFILLKFLSLITRNTKTVMSLTHPSINKRIKFLSKIKPDLILAQSYKKQSFFEELGFKTEYLVTSGVDVRQITPVSDKIKNQLRKKYNLNQKSFIILHVGPINNTRNLEIFTDLQKKVKGQVLIIGSPSAKTDNNLINLLKKSGCIAWVKYFAHIEELYQLSDVYIFPTRNPYGAIEMPLSILEAMSCNLPVVTFSFGGLQDFFKDINGLYFVKTENEFLETIANIFKKPIESNTRKAVLKLSWENIAKQLIKVYEKLIS